jgi:UDP-galactopyranose mutase
MKKYDIVIVGAGISGAVLAERYASIGHHVLVIDKRPHVGGNCFDYYNDDGILVSKYGAHLFHTNYDEVWQYINRFSNWYKYEHRVLAYVDNKYVPVPVNITTVNELLGTDIKNEKEMKKWLSEHQVKIDNPKNGEEAALARVGPVLYEKLFKYYTKKQWDKYPHELDASVTNRIPVRTNFDDRYFSDIYQYLPENGYTEFFKNIFDHRRITVSLDTDFFEFRNELSNCNKLFYTGPIDQFFDFKYSVDEKLEYRSINFKFETHAKKFYQNNSVINYSSLDQPYTRIVEYKHFTKQIHSKTTICKEYTVDDGEPYYPVPNPRNHAIYSKYKKAADEIENVYFVGRLANYKYFNMDQAFKNALELFNTLEKDNMSYDSYQFYTRPNLLVQDDYPVGNKT